jgi:hypothetical protein
VVDIDIQVKGVRDFVALTKRLRAAADKDLTKELSRAISKAVVPLRRDLRNSARTILPKRGGLAERVARTPVRVNKRTGGFEAGVRVIAVSKSQIVAINKGTVRHPLYANRQHWFNQAVTPGWWTTPTEQIAPTVRDEIVQAINIVVRKIEG